MLFWTSFSAAEPISVNSTADNTTEDEECTLREAIENAQGASHVDCVAGTFGLDEIHFNYDENHAPVVLDNSNPISLTDINEDVLDTNNTGDQIAKLIKGMIKDAPVDEPPPPQAISQPIHPSQLVTYDLKITLKGEGKVTGTGIYCGTDCEEEHVNGTRITLSPQPDNGYAFIKWTGGCAAMPLN